MAHRVSWRIEAFEFDSLADLDYVASSNTAVHVGNTPARVLVRNKSGTCRRHDAFVAAGVIAMLVCVEDLRDGPTSIFCDRQALVEVEGIDRERVSGLRAGNQVIEVAVSVARPDLFDNHGEASCRA